MARYSEKKKAAVDAMMRDEVYRVAVEVLVSEGIGALTMDRIAQGVGVSRGTLYNYFDDADEVMIFVCDRTFLPLEEEMGRIAAGSAAPQEKLRLMAEAAFDALYEDRSLVVALFWRDDTAGRRKDHKVEQRARILAVGQRVVEEGIEAGVFRDLPAIMVSEIYFGAVSGFIETMVYSGEFRGSEEIVPVFIEVLLGGLLLQVPEKKQ